MKNLVQRSGIAARRQESPNIVSFDNGTLLFSPKQNSFASTLTGSRNSQDSVSPWKGSIICVRSASPDKLRVLSRVVIWGYIWKSGFLGHSQVLHCHSSAKSHSSNRHQLTAELYIFRKQIIHKHPAKRELPKLPALKLFGGRKHGFVLHMSQTIV